MKWMSRYAFALIFALNALLASCTSSQNPPPQVGPAAAPPQRQQWIEMFARGYFPGRSGQVFVVPKEGWFVTSHDPLYSFMHGSPWDYDTHIPVLFYGAPFVKAGEYPALAKQQ